MLRYALLYYRRRCCTSLALALPTSMHNHIHLSAHRHAPCMRVLRKQYQSAHAAARVQDAEEPEPTWVRYPAPLNGTRSGSFAVEQVDGRARHLTWSASRGIQKEWRELTEVNSKTGEAVVPAKSSRAGRVVSWLRQMFLPTNYPHSVHKSYLPYHGLQLLECVVGTLVSVLCNQALLVSVGVSAEGSVFGAVAVQWIIKDGAGEIAKLFFIRKYASFFDSHPKTFNLIAAGGVLFGSGLQIVSLVVPATATNFLICAAGGNIFKLIGNAVWFTTHIKFVRCFAEQGNTGDVAAKSESQASVGQLLGYAAGIGLLTVSHSAPYLYAIFAVSVPMHLGITAWMLRVATFELLTLPRLSYLANEYVWRRDIVPLCSLEENRKTGLFGEFFKTKQDKYVTLTPRVEDVVASDNELDRRRWEACIHTFDHESYMLYLPWWRHGTLDQPISVFYHPSATTDDMLRSVLHAACLRRILSDSPKLDDSVSTAVQSPEDVELDVLYSALDKSTRWTHRHFGEFKRQLQEQEWRTDEIGFADHGRRVLWGSAASRAAP